MNKEKKLWEESKYAHEFPKDWYVIPTSESIEILKETKKEILEKIALTEDILLETLTHLTQPLTKKEMFHKISIEFKKLKEDLKDG